MFNIQVGTAITLAITDGSKAEGALAGVSYILAGRKNCFRGGPSSTG